MADITDRLSLKFWNGFYYCTVKFLDGTSQELKSDKDLTYTEWQAKVKAAWETHTAPPPPPKECTCPACKKPFICPNRTI